MSEKRKGVIFCNYEGKWKDELENRLQRDAAVTLTAIGRIRYQLLEYLQKREDIEMIKLETKYMKNRDKGIGIKISVRKTTKRPPAPKPRGVNRTGEGKLLKHKSFST